MNRGTAVNTHTHCDRCGADLRTTGHTMSRFNTDTICPDCEDAERRHPEYQRAVQVEQEQIRRGNYNFAGIGLPEDLKNKKSN